MDGRMDTGSRLSTYIYFAASPTTIHQGTFEGDHRGLTMIYGRMRVQT